MITASREFLNVMTVKVCLDHMIDLIPDSWCTADCIFLVFLFRSTPFWVSPFLIFIDHNFSLAINNFE